MVEETNVKPDTLKQQWSSLVPKIRDRFPNLSDQDIQQINGDLEMLVAKVSQKHGLSKAEIMNDLTTLITPPEKTVAGNPSGKFQDEFAGKKFQDESTGQKFQDESTGKKR